MHQNKEPIPGMYSTKNSTIFRVFIVTIVLLGAAILCSAYVIISQYSEKLFQSEISVAEESVKEFSKEAIKQASFVSTVSDPSYLFTHKIEGVMLDILKDQENAYTTKTANTVLEYFETCGNQNSNVLEMFVISKEGPAYHYNASGTGTTYLTLVSYPYFQIEEIQTFMNSSEATTVFCDPDPLYMTRISVPVITYVRKIYNTANTQTREVIGIVIVNFLYENLNACCRQSFLNKGGTILLYDSNEKIIYSSNSEDIGKHLKDSYVLEDNHSTVLSDSLEMFGLTATGIISKAQLFQEVNNMRYSQFFLVTLFIAIGIIISWFIFKQYYHRIFLLVSVLQQTDLSKRAPVTSNDEISLISQAYNNMCEQMQEWINRHYRAQIQLRTAELQTLTAQFNPHYIFNTLESIRMQAVLSGDEKVSDMLLKFGYLFRWAMRTDRPVIRLEEELAYIQAYLELQCIRFTDSLHITITAADQLLDYGIPKLILQPIAENAIIHGLPDSTDVAQPLNITIEVIEENSNLVFCVKDSGRGISKKKLTEIRASLDKYVPEENETINIGCRNVHNRLRLMFGNSYGLEIDSVEGQGTVVRGKFPKMSLEEMNALV